MVCIGEVGLNPRASLKFESEDRRPNSLFKKVNTGMLKVLFGLCADNSGFEALLSTICFQSF